MLENIDGVMHLYVACGRVAFDILSLTSELPPLCLIGTMVGLFQLYVSCPRSGIRSLVTIISAHHWLMANT